MGVPSWTAEEAAALGGAVELEIAVRRPDGGLRAWTPIWVASVDGQVYVRSWYRRESGWFGAAVGSRRARVRVPGLEAEVTVEDVGDSDAGLRADVDAAYRAGYGAGAASMVTAEAAATTLRLVPHPVDGAA
ncbi:DUF2255 family protein [Modestobacter versicolor]|uniref:DUF2255 domain-containing protein n=1 Tax=Modestobacter versicolor TaxID=429133 RepID=A0A323VBZ6_9ACTN|nr:DUF2255 family protein [Modestobacter versicolor]MBB3675958.1 hypothetical protein [Modestobacter versicolor]PZA22364.1 DUF2255 domain-containing protein [Modestobacter versicolor]